jgi:diaminopimelate decarboxylase
VLGEAGKYEGFHVHYAVKANFNPRLLQIISASGLGADCVSGGEVQAALNAGVAPEKIVFAGVGKTEKEIRLSLEADIFCFNVESLPEAELINELAAEYGKKAEIAIRVNPGVAAHTHANITTGLAENKFGINYELLPDVIAEIKKMENLTLVGLHFHIGSQILEMEDFVALCGRVNEIQDVLESEQGLVLPHINVGGGLGIDYNNPVGNPVPDFAKYFATYAANLKLRSGQQVHFELGRSIVAQCGTLVSRVTYVKHGTCKKFVIVDAGMNDLVRPALYQAYHEIENITSDAEKEVYDIVGPICESSDVFAKDRNISAAKRGDILAIRSAGAYGEAMAFGYNCRKLAEAYLSTDF